MNAKECIFGEFPGMFGGSDIGIGEKCFLVEAVVLDVLAGEEEMLWCMILIFLENWAFFTSHRLEPRVRAKGS